MKKQSQFSKSVRGYILVISLLLFGATESVQAEWWSSDGFSKSLNTSGEPVGGGPGYSNIIDPNNVELTHGLSEKMLDTGVA